MTISFSGLASGLDTSSWIESLVALKRAKVTTLNTQKQEISSAKETLTNIKTFFNNFRSTIQKITNTHLNPMSTNVFVQNIATSSDLNVLTAIATSEAEEGTYKVKVDKLATKTNASSGYKKTVTTTVTATATESSYLKHIGVEAGNIGVTVDGIKYNVEITENDTIESFIDKLGKVGVSANYNESSGVFSMNIGINDIDDDIDNDGIDNTKIKEKLHLEGVKGYKTQTNLTYESVVTDGANAKGDTKLNDLGVGNGEITIQANGAPYTITIDSNTTLDSFVADLKSKHINAKYDESTGLLTFDDAVITDEGTTSIKTALGLEEDVFSQSQATDKLSLQTVITQVTTVTADTKLKDIGEGTAIEDGDTVVITNSNNEKTTVTIGETTSVGELLSSISSSGLRATITSSGTIEISGGKIEKGDGSVFDPITALGLEVVPYTAMVTGKALSETGLGSETATLQSRLVEDLGVTKGYVEVTDADGNKYYEKISSGQTISNFKSDMGSLGIYVDLDEETGVLSITGGSFRTLNSAEVQELITNGTITESDAEYINGSNLLQRFYGSDVISTDHIEVASTYSKTEALRQITTVTQNATLDSKLSVIGLTTEGTAIFDVNGSQVTIDVTKEMSIDDLRNSLDTKGIETEWDSTNSKLTIKGATLAGGTSDLGDVLGLTTVISSKHATTGSLYAKTTAEVSVSLDTKLEDLSITGNQSVTLHTEDGNSRTFDVTGETTLEGFLAQLNSAGEIARFENGVLTIDGGYISNTAIENALGMDRTINGTSSVLGTKLTHTVIATATGEATLGDIVSALGVESAVSGGYTLSFNSEALTVDSNTSIESIISQIETKGGTASLDSAGVLTISGGTLTGTVAEALGFTSHTPIIAVSAAGKILTAYSTSNADETTTFGELGYSTPQTVTVLSSSSGTVVATVTTASNMTLQAFMDELSQWGFNGSITSGRLNFTFEAPMGHSHYLVGDLMDEMGIGTYTETSTVSTTTTTTQTLETTTTSVTATTVTADATTIESMTLGELGMDYFYFYEYLGGPEKASVTFDLVRQDVYAGTTSTIATKTEFALSETTTLGDICESLSSLTDGDLVATIEGGRIKLSSNNNFCYLLSGSVASELGFENVTATISCTISDISTVLTPTASSDALTYDTGSGLAPVDTGTPLSSLGFVEDTEEDVYIYSIDSNGTQTLISTLVVRETDALGTFFTTTVGASFSVVGGVPKFSVQEGYMVSLSADLTQALNLSKDCEDNTGSYTETHPALITNQSKLFEKVNYVTEEVPATETVTTSVTTTQELTSTFNDESDILIANKVTTFDGNAELGLLQDSSGNKVSNYELIVSTDSGGSTSQTFSSTSSVQDVIDFLVDNYGFEVSIVDNKLVVRSETVSDFDISGGLGEFLMGENFTIDSEEGITTNTSTNLKQHAEANMELTTKLSDLGITDGNIVVYKDGVKSTIAVDSTKTVQEFLSEQLGAFGITGSVSDGKLSLSSNGVVYFETPASSASNLVDKIGLAQANWTKGDYSQESDNLGSISETTVDNASANTKLKDLTDSEGNSLGITSGKLYVYQNGIRETIDVDAEDTLATFATKLSDYGITLDLSDGVISLDGAGNSYVTTEDLNNLVASNVLTQLGINSWEENYSSVSKNITYDNEELSKDVGATKLVDLKDSSGNSLGITEGAYYVYKNGVRHTETITADMTVNELREKLSSYGLESSINNDGSISFTAYDNTYLATAETAGANSNIVTTMFGDWEAVNIYTSDSIINSNETTASITRDTKLANINVADPANAFQAGYITVVKNGVQKNIELTDDTTVGDLMDELSLYGFESIINSRGELIINATDGSSLKEYTGAGQASNALTLLGIDPNSWIVTNTYNGSPLSVVTSSTETVCATRDTLLSDLEYFKNNPSAKLEGEYYIYKDGVKYTAMISSDETLGSFMETLASFGIQTSLINDNIDDGDGIGATLSIIGSGDSYLAKSVNTSKASDVIDIFVGDIASTYKYSGAQAVDVTSVVAATDDTLLSKFDTPTLKAQGDLSVTVDGVTNIVQISADETFGSFKAKLAKLGLEAILSEDGQFVIQSGNKNFSISTLGTANESKLIDTLGLNFDDMGGFVSSTAVIEDTHEMVETDYLSVANYASEDTTLNLLNITGGSLTIYRDGQKAIVTIDPTKDFNKLKEDIQAHFGEDVDLKFEEGYLTIFSKTEGVKLEIGALSDTSNFTAITGMQTGENGELRSAKDLYCVNTSSKITEAGIFRNGNVTEGSFKIGAAVFTIESNTTLADIISQINASQEANATAYWDSVNAKLVIQSRASGASLINIEAGTSNFTDVMGLTTSEWSDTDSDGDGKKDLVVTKVNTESQVLGENAKFSINGTQYTSTSNTITSSVSKINGLTIDLKGVTNEEDGETTITVERDKNTVSNAISDIVDAYNELIKNVDKELSKGGSLDDQFGLKLLRSQIRNLMTGTIMTPGAYKSLSAIGVSIEKASASNISTENIDKLYFDEEKFLKAFDADRDAIKGLLIGTSETDKGIFGTLDETLDKALNYSVGYFQTAQRSYTNQVSKISNQISKAETATDRYRERLEKKFSSMDLLISKIQNQYSSFLAT